VLQRSKMGFISRFAVRVGLSPHPALQAPAWRSWQATSFFIVDTGT
jgi:hypothetical protein